jgi:hypothetical protein
MRLGNKKEAYSFIRFICFDISDINIDIPLQCVIIPNKFYTGNPV